MLDANGRPIRMSVSRYLATFSEEVERCPRKTFYGSVLHVPQKKSVSASDGRAFHAAVEDYERGGREALNAVTSVEGVESPAHVKRFRDLAVNAIPGTGLSVPLDPSIWAIEHELDAVIQVPGYEPMDFKGFIDLARLDKPWILDWKTTSSRDFRWAKMPSDLATNPQLLTYAYLMYQDNAPSRVRVEHLNVYIGGRPKATEPVSALVPWTACEDMWHEKIVPAALSYRKLYADAVAVPDKPQLADAERVPYGDGAACRAYRGCPFADICSAHIDVRREPTPFYGETTVSDANDKKKLTKSRVSSLKRIKRWHPEGLANYDWEGTEWDAEIRALGAGGEPEPAADDPHANKGNAEVIAQAARQLGGMTSVPEALAKKVAAEHRIYVYELTQHMGLKLVEGVFVPKNPPAAKDPQDPPVEAPPVLTDAEKNERAVAMIEPGLKVSAWKKALRTEGIRERVKAVYLDACAKAAGCIVVDGAFAPITAAATEPEPPAEPAGVGTTAPETEQARKDAEAARKPETPAEPEIATEAALKGLPASGSALGTLLFGDKPRDLSGLRIVVYQDSGNFSENLVNGTIPDILRVVRATTGILADVEDCTVRDAD